MERPGWALQDIETREVLLSDICTTESEAMRMRQQMMEHQPHRGTYRIVPVVVTVEIMDG
jgi:hypothetical protein